MGSVFSSGRDGALQQAPVRVIFVHHSTGRILIREGNVRQLIAERNKPAPRPIELWDHDYNEIGLSSPEGAVLSKSYDLPGNNTNPGGFEMLFTQAVHDPPDNAFSHLLTYDVIIFKPCFPVCAIRCEDQLERYKADYRQVRRVINLHPAKLFVALTPPPLASLTLVGAIAPSSEQWTSRACPQVCQLANQPAIH